jgi:hypothetical protein
VLQDADKTKQLSFERPFEDLRHFPCLSIIIAGQVVESIERQCMTYYKVGMQLERLGEQENDIVSLKQKNLSGQQSLTT